jgi:uncharacterized repeat protein (TIGR02543 family)
MPNEDTTIVCKYIGVPVTLNVVSSDLEHGVAENKTTTFLSGDLVSLLAAASPGYTFTGWYVLDEKISGNCSFNYKVTKYETTITAQFVPNETLVTLVSSDLSEGSVALSTTEFDPGSEVIATATPTKFYSFVGWYTGTDLISNEIAYTFSVTSTPITLVAKFIRDKYTLSIKIITPENNEELYEYGIFRGASLVSLVPRDNDYYNFSEWRTIDDTLLGTSLDLEYTMPNEDTTIVNKYIGVSVTLNVVSSNPEWGEAKNNTTHFLSGDLVSLLAEAHAGCTFTGWYVLGEKISDNYSLNYKVTKYETTITAKFGKLYNFEAIIKAGAGEITGSGNGAFLPGTIISISVTTTSGYDFVGWYISDTLVGSSVECSYTMSAEDVTIEAKVVAKYNYSANTFNANMGTINGANSGTFSVVNPVNITTTPKEGYEFDGWYKGSELLSLDESYILSDQTTAQEITARFILSGMTCKLYNEMYLIETYTGNLTSIIIPDMYKGHVLQGFYGEPHLPQEISVSVFDDIVKNQNNLKGNSLFQDRTLDKVTFLSTEMFEYNDCSPFYNTSINEVIMPDGIIKIPYFLFSATNIDSIEIPASLKVIEAGAFWRSSISSLDLPSNLEGIGIGAFANCANLESIDIPGSVKIISAEAFTSCLKLASVNIQEGVQEIHWRAFSSCVRLTSVSVPSSVTNIGENVFTSCIILEYVELKADCELIPAGTFAQCSALKVLVLSKKYTGCMSTAFYLPTSVTNKIKIFSLVESTNELLGLKTSINAELAQTGQITAEYYAYSGTRKAGSYWCYVNGVPTPWSEIE